MVLEIRTTGIEDYLPGGEANLKTLIVGGPDVGKTRWASFWPSPIYADCEAGRGSIADRNVPYVEIGIKAAPSVDMLQFLRWLKQMMSKPKAERPYQTVVIDTIDSFQRKLKNEYLEAHPEMQSFSGFDAWGWLDTKMQMLMTRLLNLDMNVVVLAHYKDKTRTEGSGDQKVEVVERMLQLQGDIKDTAFNDFDFVGRMDYFWESDGESRVQKRGLTFHKSPDWPILKDRLGVTPKWLPVEFSEEDYTRLFEAFSSRLDGLVEGEVVGQVEAPADDEVKGEGVTGPLGGGPVPPQDPKDMPLDQLKKDELIQMARSMPSIADEVKTNLLKSELVKLIERGRYEEAEKATENTAEVPDEEVKQAVQQSEEASSSTEESSTDVQGDGSRRVAHDEASGKDYDPETGEVMTPEQVAEELGATVVSEDEAADTTGSGQEPAAEPERDKPQPEAQPEPAEQQTKEGKREPYCEECGTFVGPDSEQNQDYVRLAWIKFRKVLCNDDYQTAKKAKAAN